MNDREDAEALGVQKHPHGDVEQWLEHNLQDEERGPVSHVEHHDHPDQAPKPARSRPSDDDNLVQLPVGATFGMDHEPTPQEREELLRFAAEADAELRERPDRDPEE